MTTNTAAVFDWRYILEKATSPAARVQCFKRVVKG